MLDQNIIQRPRAVGSIIQATETYEGGGFFVQRPFPTEALLDLDPFLLLDEMGPSDYEPGKAIGAPDHPHRGFETVTYLFSGAMQHKDSNGHTGTLTPGDVQWMTAGSGVIHSELPADDFQKTGGTLHGVQLWINLPSHEKMVSPQYQEIPAAQIPQSASEDGLVNVHVLAGESLGAQSIISTRTPILYLHVIIQPGGQFQQHIPEDFNAFAYVIDGEGEFDAGGIRGEDAQMLIFDTEGDGVRIHVPNDAPEPLNCLLIAGRPLNEPVVRYGPFVMNNEAQIHEAIEDFRSGRFGQIKQ